MDRHRARKAGLRAIMMLLATTATLGTFRPPAVSAGENQVFFRAGFAAAASDRSGEIFTDTNNATKQGLNDGQTGYYIGAAADLAMHKNFLGFKGMSLLGEIGVEFKRFASNTVASGVPTLTSLAGVPLGQPSTAKVPITMLTVSVSPKLKFWEGQKLRPWIIPIGMDFHVISPPSNQAAYLDVGAQFGAGLEYNIWGPINLGLDGRFHWAAGMTNTTNNFGTVGGYVGILF